MRLLPPLKRLASPRPAKLALGLVWGLLAVNLALAVARFQPNVLTWDQWDFFRPLFQQKGWWALFHYQHGPHRQGLGFILTALVARATSWDSRWDSLWIVSLLSLSALLALRLKWRITGTLTLNDVWVPILCLTLGQFEALLITPNASHSAFPLALTLLLALLWLGSNPWLRYSFAGVGAVCLTFTGFGLFAGAVLTLLLALAAARHWKFGERRDAFLAAGGCVIAVAGWVLFRSDYVFAPAVANFRFPWTPLSDYARFISLMLVQPSGADRGTGAARYAVGAFLGLIVVLSCIRIAWSWLGTWRMQDSRVQDVLVFLLGSGALFVCNAAVGRISLGVTAGMSSRYITLMFPIWLGVYLAALTSRRRTLVVAASLVLWSIALWPYRDMIRRPLVEWPGTIGATAEQCRYFEFYTTHKAAWVDAYLRTKSPEQAQAEIGNFVYPNPKATSMDAKLAFLRTHRLSFFSGDSYLPWFLGDRVIWNNQFPFTNAPHPLGRSSTCTFIAGKRNGFVEVPLTASTPKVGGFILQLTRQGKAQEIQITQLPTLLFVPSQFGFNNIGFAPRNAGKTQTPLPTVLAGPVKWRLTPPPNSLVAK